MSSAATADATSHQSPPPISLSQSDLSPEATAIRSSALWAAWGDAIGFPTELANEQLVARRLRGATLDDLPVSWERRVGGRMGPMVELPAGAYSDDTQLRLAVGRCIRAAGQFDVEVFSKVELPVFLSYALGAGRGTKAAAQGLARKAARWYSPFGKDARAYVGGGGNGAAMRIQPHVWASPAWRPDAYLPQVLKDAICTHGHPRAIVGALLHALCLGTALHERQIPAPDRWVSMGKYLGVAKELPTRDEALAERWLFDWEQAAGRSWAEATQEVIAETVSQLGVAARRSHDSGAWAYQELALELGGLDPNTRGAGNVSAVLALWLAWHGQNQPERALRDGAALLGSDTDTVASMAGALLGVITTDPPPGDLQDAELIGAEADRLASLRERPAPSFPHPDPLHWQPPSSLSDAYGTIGRVPYVAGLGAAEPLGELLRGQGKSGGIWQWVRLDFGQTLLIKRREHLPELSASSMPRERAGHIPDSSEAPTRDVAARSDQRLPNGAALAGESNELTIGLALAQVAQSDFDPLTVGVLTLQLLEGPDGPYNAGLFAFRVGELLRAETGRR
jgi:ADP-ribosylglycohydrolase